LGGEAAYARTDVKRRDDVSNLVKLAGERYGKLDVLVNNAGIMPISPSTTCASRIGRR
jgi:NADP-dependent 3-hydroxy acid dehydrogenase YdfG